MRVIFRHASIAIEKLCEGAQVLLRFNNDVAARPGTETMNASTNSDDQSHSDDQSDPVSSLDDFIELSGARPSDKVIIAGAKHLDLLLSLMRHGFAQVICQASTQDPCVGQSPADIILAPAVRSETDLLSILRRLGSVLRRGGVLVLQTTQPFNFLNNARLRQALADIGCSDFDRVASRGDGGFVWRTQRRALAVHRAA